MAIINVTPSASHVTNIEVNNQDAIIFEGNGQVTFNGFTINSEHNGTSTSFYAVSTGRYETSKGAIAITVKGQALEVIDLRAALLLDYNHRDNYVTFKDIKGGEGGNFDPSKYYTKGESDIISKAIEDSLARKAVTYTLATGVEIYNGNNSETYVVKNGQHVELTMLLINKTGGNIAANTTIVTIPPGDRPGRSKVFSGLAGTSFGSMTPVGFHLSGVTGELQCYTVLPANTNIVIDSSYMLPPVV